MTIDLKKFSLGTQVTIRRYTGVFTNGVFVRTLASSINTWASVQPYSTIEADQIMDPTTGEYVDQIRLMYTTELMYINDREETHNVSDLVVIDGDIWKPMKIENWNHLSNPHYRVLLRRFEGY